MDTHFGHEKSEIEIKNAGKEQIRKGITNKGHIRKRRAASQNTENITVLQKLQGSTHFTEYKRV